MTIQEAIKSGRPFKRPCHMYWMSVNTCSNKVIYVTDIGTVNWVPNVEDYLATDYIIKEEWYEGDFKEKYPNGVLCFVVNDLDDTKKVVIIVDYRDDIGLEDINGFYYSEKNIIPVRPEEAPAIIGE